MLRARESREASSQQRGDSLHGLKNAYPVARDISSSKNRTGVASNSKLCMPTRSCFDGAQHERASSVASFFVRPELVEGERKKTVHSFNVEVALLWALVFRSVFAELNKHPRTRPLYLSPRLVS